MSFSGILTALQGSPPFSSPRSTFIGVMMVLAGIASLLHIQINGVTFTGDPWTLISGGIGFIITKDAATHSTLAQVEHSTVVATAKAEAAKAEAPKP